MSRWLAAALVLPAAAAAPAAAAPVLRSPLKPCYVSVDRRDREPVVLDATGFTPGATVDVSVDGKLQGSGVADATGVLKGQVQAPWQPAGERQFALRLAERDNPAGTLLLYPRVSALWVGITPARARPWRRVLFRGRGFTAPRDVFAHYRFRGRLRRTVSLGRPVGDCGLFSVRARQIPVRHAHAGRWTVVFDQRRHATTSPEVSDRLIIVVRRPRRSH
ncbi:MAG TPA: hypothetical protein VH418_02655 [Solirubrobacteraceae bacterium]